MSLEIKFGAGVAAEKTAPTKNDFSRTSEGTLAARPLSYHFSSTGGGEEPPPGDTTAPTITSGNALTVAENAAFSHTLTANESVTWTKTGGADTALFTLSGNTLTMTAKNFEAPVDDGANNTYVVQVTATDAAGNATNQTITVTVTDVAEATTTWSTTDKAASLTLTNNNLTATKTGAAAYAGIRSTTSKSAGKWVFKINVTTATVASDNLNVGIATSVWSRNNYLGANAVGVGIFMDGSVFFNNTEIGTWAAAQAAPVSFFVAVDFDNDTIQTSFDGSTWSSAFSIAGISGAWFAAGCGYATNDAFTVDFGPSGWTLAGFANWG